MYTQACKRRQSVQQLSKGRSSSGSSTKKSKREGLFNFGYRIGDQRGGPLRLESLMSFIYPITVTMLASLPDSRMERSRSYPLIALRGEVLGRTFTTCAMSFSTEIVSMARSNVSVA